jgi:hypothetical protein
LKNIVALILITIPQILYGQTDRYPIIKTSGKTIEEFVPRNWKILQKATGDLNKDDLNDIVVVLQETDPSKIKLLKSEEVADDTVDSNRRILIVLFQDSITNSYVLKGQTNTFVLGRYSSTMSDPFQGIGISKGKLIIEFFLWYSAGSWYQTNLAYIFRFQKGQMTLIGAEYNEVHRGTSEGTNRSFNFSTKKMSETKSKLGDNGEMIEEKTKWNTLTIKELKTLGTVTQPLDWEPIKGIQI